MGSEGYLRFGHDGKEFMLDIGLGRGFKIFQYFDRYFDGVVSEYYKCRRQRGEDWKRQMEEEEVFNRISLKLQCGVSIQQKGILDGMVEEHNDYVDLWKRYLFMVRISRMYDGEIKERFGKDVNRNNLASFIDKLDIGELQTNQKAF